MTSYSKILLNNWKFTLALTLFDLKSRYFNKKIGLFWLVLDPLGVAILYFIVFEIFGVSSNLGPSPYILFVFSNLTLWTFIKNTLTMSSNVYNKNANLISSLPIPILSWIFRTILVGIIQFFLLTLILIPMIIIFNVQNFNLLIYITAFISAVLIIIPISIIFAIIGVLIQDWTHVVGLIMIFLRYATPIIYSLNYVPQDYINYWLLNPLILPFYFLEYSIFAFEEINSLIYLNFVIFNVSMYIVAYIFIKIFLNSIRKLI